MLRPQVFQEVMTNEKFMTCDYCKRILYYVPPPPKPEDEKAAKTPAASHSRRRAPFSGRNRLQLILQE